MKLVLWLPLPDCTSEGSFSTGDSSLVQGPQQIDQACNSGTLQLGLSSSLPLEDGAVLVDRRRGCQISPRVEMRARYSPRTVSWAFKLEIEFYCALRELLRRSFR